MLTIVSLRVRDTNGSNQPAIVNNSFPLSTEWERTTKVEYRFVRDGVIRYKREGLQ